MPLILGTNSIKDTGYEVANSCRFNDDSDDHLDRTPSSSGNRRTWTWSCWFKRASFTSNSRVFVAHSDNSNRVEIGIHNETVNCFRVELLSSSSNSELQTNAVFRDPSAWFHAVVSVDTTQGTDSNRVKLYINGTQVTSFQTESYPTQNTEYVINHTVEHNIGKSVNFSRPYDGYMCEVVLIDGQQLGPTSFGEFDSDSPTIWKPIDVSGLTFGTNGFYLDFENSGSLGADVSGNGNNFTVNNLTSIDQSTDTCTNNFATLNPLNVPTSNAPTFAEGNLFGESVTGGTSTVAFGGSSTFGLTQGKWYLEAKCGSSTNRDAIGVTGEASECARTNNSGISRTNSSFLYSGETGTVYVNSSSTSYGNTFGNNDIIGVALDLDNLKVYFSKNGTWQNSGDPTSGSTGTGAISITSVSSTTDGAYFINHGSTAGGGAPSGKSVFNFNFGSPPYSISSGNSDAEGFGNFEYPVPSGYFALCTKNLSEYG